MLRYPVEGKRAAPEGGDDQEGDAARYWGLSWRSQEATKMARKLWNHDVMFEGKARMMILRTKYFTKIHKKS